MLCSEGIPENTESPDSHYIPEVWGFFFVVWAFSFQRRSGVVELLSHTDFRVSFEKGVL